MKIQTLINRAEASFIKHRADCDHLLKEVKKMIDPDCILGADVSIFHQPGDGLVLSYDSYNITVDSIATRFNATGECIDFYTLVRLAI